MQLDAHFAHKPRRCTLNTALKPVEEVGLDAVRNKESERLLQKRAVQDCFMEKWSRGQDVTIVDLLEVKGAKSDSYTRKLGACYFKRLEKCFFVKARVAGDDPRLSLEEKMRVRHAYHRHDITTGLFAYNLRTKKAEELDEDAFSEKFESPDLKLDHTIEEITDIRPMTVIVEIQPWVEGPNLEELLKDEEKKDSLSEYDVGLAGKTVKAIHDWHQERNTDIPQREYAQDYFTKYRRRSLDNTTPFFEMLPDKRKALFREHMLNVLSRMLRHIPRDKPNPHLGYGKLKRLFGYASAIGWKFIDEFGHIVSVHGDLRDRNIKFTPEGPAQLVDPYLPTYGVDGWDLGRLLCDLIELYAVTGKSWHLLFAKKILELYRTRTEDEKGSIDSLVCMGIASKFFRKLFPDNPRHLSGEQTLRFAKIVEHMLRLGKFDLSFS